MSPLTFPCASYIEISSLMCDEKLGLRSGCWSDYGGGLTIEYTGQASL